MILYYNKQTMKQTNIQSEDTIPITDKLMADYRHYASNQQDKSLDLIQEIGQVPYLVKYKLDDNGNRFSNYTDKVDKDGYKLPDMEAIEQAKVDSELEAKKSEAKAYLDSTDWYVTRNSEVGVEIPDEVVAKRQECRELL